MIIIFDFLLSDVQLILQSIRISMILLCDILYAYHVVKYELVNDLLNSNNSIIQLCFV